MKDSLLFFSNPISTHSHPLFFLPCIMRLALLSSSFSSPSFSSVPAVTGKPFFIVSSLSHRWLFGWEGCRFYGWAGFFFGCGSLITMTLVSLDRYLKICHLRYGTSESLLTVSTKHLNSMCTVGHLFIFNRRNYPDKKTFFHLWKLFLSLFYIKKKTQKLVYGSWEKIFWWSIFFCEKRWKSFFFFFCNTHFGQKRNVYMIVFPINLDS